MAIERVRSWDASGQNECLGQLLIGEKTPFFFTLDASKVTHCGIVDSELAGEIKYLISHLAIERLGIPQEERDVWNHCLSLSVRK